MPHEEATVRRVRTCIGRKEVWLLFARRAGPIKRVGGSRIVQTDPMPPKLSCSRPMRTEAYERIGYPRST